MTNVTNFSSRLFGCGLVASCSPADVSNYAHSGHLQCFVFSTIFVHRQPAKAALIYLFTDWLHHPIRGEWPIRELTRACSKSILYIGLIIWAFCNASNQAFTTRHSSLQLNLFLTSIWNFCKIAILFVFSYVNIHTAFCSSNTYVLLEHGTP